VEEAEFNIARMFNINTIFDFLLLVFFLAFAIRIFLKDVFFVLFEVDSIYLAYCRCN